LASPPRAWPGALVAWWVETWSGEWRGRGEEVDATARSRPASLVPTPDSPLPDFPASKRSLRRAACVLLLVIFVVSRTRALCAYRNSGFYSGRSLLQSSLMNMNPLSRQLQSNWADSRHHYSSYSIQARRTPSWADSPVSPEAHQLRPCSIVPD
jgi:hypothetical protein